jgi:glycosyltransferase involved in cell wall biosynthesis
MKSKLLCILHRSPPAHGAAKVGDFIGESKKLKDKFDCKFITIKSSDTIGDIGKISFKKLYLVAELYFKILFTILVFRPDYIYFTASVKGIAFYRDVLLSTLWKVYKVFKKCDIFYHYHTKGVNNFVKNSNKNLVITKFFLKKINLILLSPLLEEDFKSVKTYKKVLFLPNGVEDNMKDINLDIYFKKKYTNIKTLEVLYLAHMMKDKGYIEAIELANLYKNKNIHFNFAGTWKDKQSKKDFFKYIENNNLDKTITYHGFVSGSKKENLQKNSHILLYPSKNDAFPLTILESLSYGIPVLATSEGSIPFIIDKKSGTVVENLNDLPQAFEDSLKKLVNIENAKYCRQRYLDHFSLEQFENNLVQIFK